MSDFFELARRISRSYPIEESQVVLLESNETLSGSIDPYTWQTYLYIPQNLEKNFADRGIDQQEIPSVMEFLVRHEFGHWKYCPSSKEGIELVSSGIVDAARELRMRASQPMLNYLANLFEDVISNTANMFLSVESLSDRYRTGFEYFYIYDSKTVLEKLSGEHNFLTPEMQIFLTFQAKLFSISANSQFNRYIQSVAAKKEKTGEGSAGFNIELATDQFSRIIAGVSFSKLGQLSIEEKEEIARELVSPSVWYYRSKEMAKLLLPFMRDNFLPFNFVVAEIRHPDKDSEAKPVKIPFKGRRRVERAFRGFGLWRSVRVEEIQGGNTFKRVVLDA